MLGREMIHMAQQNAQGAKRSADAELDERFGVSQETLEHVVRVGRARILESFFSAMSNWSDVLSEAMHAFRTGNREAFEDAL